MKEIQLCNVRHAILEVIDAEDVEQMKDKDLLDSDFMEDLLMDSLEIIEVVMILEFEFGITVPDESYERFKKNGGTVKAMLDELNRVIKQ